MNVVTSHKCLGFSVQDDVCVNSLTLEGLLVTFTCGTFLRSHLKAGGISSRHKYFGADRGHIRNLQYTDVMQKLFFR